MDDFERAWRKQLAAEKKYIDERSRRSDSRLNRFLQTKVPEKLKDTLTRALQRLLSLSSQRERELSKKPTTAAISSAAAVCGA